MPRKLEQKAESRRRSEVSAPSATASRREAWTTAERAYSPLRSVVVQKYGGSSISDLDLVRSVARQVVETRRRRGPLVVVVSAMGDATDELLQQARALSDDLPSGELALLLSTGEQRSIALLALAIRSLGEEAVALTGPQCGIITDDSPLDATILEIRPHRILEELARGRIVVAAGFQGVDGEDRITTLGRGGSDTTAVALTAALGAESCEIYTDVAGVFTADPRVVPTAERLHALDHPTMEELAFRGGYVLKREAVELARRNGVDIRVASSSSQEGATLVHSGHDHHRPVFRPRPASPVGLCGRTDLLRLCVHPARLDPQKRRELHEFLSRWEIFFFNESGDGAAARYYVGTSEIPPARTVREELERRFGEAVEVSDSLAAVSLVDLERETRRALLSSVTGGTAGQDLPILEVFTAARSVTLIVPRDEMRRAMQSLHQSSLAIGRDGTPRPHDLGPTLEGTPPAAAPVGSGRVEVLGRPPVDLLLLGWGKIGRRLARLVAEQRDDLLVRGRVSLRLAALCDRSGYLLLPDASEAAELDELVLRKEAGEPVASLPGAVAAAGAAQMVRAAVSASPHRRVLVDVSDADEADEIFREALACGCDVVTANKKPLATSPDAYYRLLEASRSADRRIRGEATVGAGLPILDTLETLVLTGDRIQRIEGCLSGTLSALMSWLEEGSPFSEAVARAVEHAYTEPDPAVDLTGSDVARKALILGRLSGLADGGTQVRLEGLVDSTFVGLSPSKLYERLRNEVDGPLSRRLDACRSEGKVLRYLASVAPGRIEVGLREVPGSSGLARVRGPENAIVFHSERYADGRLTVTGPGAGVDVTAMGVLSDVLRIAADVASL